MPCSLTMYSTFYRAMGLKILSACALHVNEQQVERIIIRLSLLIMFKLGKKKRAELNIINVIKFACHYSSSSW